MKRLPGSLINRYARALYAVATKTDAVVPVRDDLEAISSVWRENPEFALLALNPRLPKTKVQRMLLSLADRIHAHEVTRHFLHLLLDKRRLEILADIGDYFRKLWQESEGQIEITVMTAVPLSDSMKQTIVQHLSQQSGRKPLVAWREDDALLGGIVVHWPERVFDGSVARKLGNLRTALAQNS